MFDAPCLFYTNCFEFHYYFVAFYTISDTNLLTRCHSASSLLSAVFGFRKVTHEIFSELDETKAETPIFPGTLQNIEEVVQPDQGPATPTLGARWPPDSVISPINCLPSENPETEIR